MKAAILEEKCRIKISDIPVPVIPNPDWVLVNTRTVGICGSEVHAFNGTHPFRKAPVVLGHEMSGVVTEIGRDVRSVEVGARVVIDPQRVCGTCRFCLSGHPNLCPSKKFLGTPEWPGAFGEYVAVPESSVFSLPGALSFAEGAAVEALSVAVHIAGRVELKPEQSVVILGCGSIGGLFSSVSKSLGAGPIIIADIHQHCLDIGCKRLGAAHDFLLPDKNFISGVDDITKGTGVDVVVICADDASLLGTGLKIVKRRGIIVVVAFLPEEELKFTAYDVIHKEVSIIGTYSANLFDFQRSIKLAASRQVDVAGIITHELPIEKAQLGFELASTKKDNAIKVVMTFP